MVKTTTQQQSRVVHGEILTDSPNETQLAAQRETENTLAHADQAMQGQLDVLQKQSMLAVSVAANVLQQKTDVRVKFDRETEVEGNTIRTRETVTAEGSLDENLLASAHLQGGSISGLSLAIIIGLSLVVGALLYRLI